MIRSLLCILVLGICSDLSAQDAANSHTGKRKSRSKRFAAETLGQSASELTTPLAENASELLGGPRHALLIGIDDYADPQVPDLTLCRKDARSVGVALTKYGQIDPNNVTTLLGSHATAREIRRALGQLTNVEKNSTIFIYFSGHGHSTSRQGINEGFLCAQDSILNEVEVTGISDAEFSRLIGRIPAKRVVVMLDCCYAGQVVGRVSSGFKSEGRAFLVASNNTPAVESDALNQSLFTKHLIDGMSGRADRDENGAIVLTELIDYVDFWVSRSSKEEGSSQRHTVSIDGVEEVSRFVVAVDPNQLKSRASLVASRRDLQQRRVGVMDKWRNQGIINAELLRQMTTLIKVPPENSGYLSNHEQRLRNIVISATDGAIAPETILALFNAGDSETEAKRDANALGIGFRLIPAGQFSMGSPETETGRRSDEPQHTVKISRPFYIGVTEVTQEQYQALHSASVNPSTFRNDGDYGFLARAHSTTGGFPVENVTWFDTLLFCNALSRAEKLPEYYTISKIEKARDSFFGFEYVKNAEVGVNGGGGYRLPTEAEWEYASRAGSNQPFQFGDKITAELSNFGRKKERITTKVGTFPANHWGLFDMHGNVREWCWDWFDSRSYSDSAMTTDPTGPATPGIRMRITRGGSWYDEKPLNVRSARRFSAPPATRRQDGGFRVARTASD